MPRLSSEELQEAKRRKAEERRETEERGRLEEERNEALLLEREQQERNQRVSERDLHDRHADVLSYVTALYDEIGKLSIKRPLDPVSKLMIGQTNRAIRDARELLAGENDPFIGEIVEFVPAGEDPANRDVVLVLRQVKEALARMASRHAIQWRHLRSF